MNNIILKYKTSVFKMLRPPQYKEGFRRFFIKNGFLLLLTSVIVVGVLSCEDKPYKSPTAPKLESMPPPKPEPKEGLTVGDQKTVYLNSATFKVINKPGDTSNVPLNKGIDELLKVYAYAPKGDIMKVLMKYKTVLNKEIADVLHLDNALKEFNAIKVQNPKSESFINFVDALAYVSTNAVQNVPTTPNVPTITTSPQPPPKVEQEKKADEKSWLTNWEIVILILFGFALFLLYLWWKNNQFKHTTPAPNMEITAMPSKVIPPKSDDRKGKQTNKENLQTAIAQKNKNEVERQRLEKIQKELNMEREKRLEAERKQAEAEAKLQSRLEIEKGADMQLPSVYEMKDENIDSLSLESAATSPVDVTPPIEKAYLSLPMNEMIFNNASKSPVPMIGQSFYEFYIDNDGQTATFKFWDNIEAVKHAIDKPHSHIEPACEPVNARDSYATRIFTEKDGFAVLEDNKWIVKTKAKIKYLA